MKTQISTLLRKKWCHEILIFKLRLWGLTSCFKYGLSDLVRESWGISGRFKHKSSVQNEPSKTPGCRWYTVDVFWFKPFVVGKLGFLELFRLPVWRLRFVVFQLFGFVMDYSTLFFTTFTSKILRRSAIPAIFQIPVSWPREVFLNEEDLESLIIKAVSPRATHEFGAFKR